MKTYYDLQNILNDENKIRRCAISKCEKMRKTRNVRKCEKQLKTRNVSI